MPVVVPTDETFCRTLTLAAHETTTVALSRILHVLSLHPENQEKLRLELMDARVERRDISYDDLMKLPYLDAICKETLRLCVDHLQIALHLPHPYYRLGTHRSPSCIEC
jgi:hypothetical protein